MEIVISNKLKEISQNITIASIIAEVCVKHSSEELLSIIKKECELINESVKNEEVSKLIPIKDLRVVYRKSGVDPTRYKISSEALIKRIVKGNSLYNVNNLIDINNLISILSGYPVCCYDLDNIVGDIIFKVGETGERYEGIGRGEIKVAGIPTFYDEKGAFGSTTSDSIRTMVKEESKRILFGIISFTAEKSLDKYIELTRELLEKYCDARIIEVKEYNS